MNILIIVAHPDDDVLGMGGTILNHTTKGDNVTIAYLTTGITSRRGDNYTNIPSYQLTKKNEQNMEKQIVQLKNNAKKACKLLKVQKSIFFDFPDNEMDTVSLLKIVKTIEKLVKENKPDIIYTSHYGDLNIDHQIVFKATLTACRPRTSSVKEIICFEILSSTEWAVPYTFRPNYFIDISKNLNKKIKAMECYKNEIRDFPHPRSIKNIKNSAEKWGTVSGFAAAEAFEIVRKIVK